MVVHKPLQDGQCRSCHDPHGGADQRFLRTASMTELCNQCHLDLVGGRSHVHGPAAAGACEACHQAHAAPLPKLLVREGRELCLSCHTQMQKQLGQVRFTHQAVQAECTSCHDPHASNYPMQTLQPPSPVVHRHLPRADPHQRARRPPTSTRPSGRTRRASTATPPTAATWPT